LWFPVRRPPRPSACAAMRLRTRHHLLACVARGMHGSRHTAARCPSALCSPRSVARRDARAGRCIACERCLRCGAGGPQTLRQPPQATNKTQQQCKSAPTARRPLHRPRPGRPNKTRQAPSLPVPGPLLHVAVARNPHTHIFAPAGHCAAPLSVAPSALAHNPRWPALRGGLKMNDGRQHWTSLFRFDRRRSFPRHGTLTSPVVSNPTAWPRNEFETAASGSMIMTLSKLSYENSGILNSCMVMHRPICTVHLRRHNRQDVEARRPAPQSTRCRGSPRVVFPTHTPFWDRQALA